MGKGLHSSPPGPVQRGRTNGHLADHQVERQHGQTASRPGPLRRAVRFVREYLPRGEGLDDATFRRRHLLLCWVLGLHVPALFAFALWQGFGVVHSTLEVMVPVACLAFARVSINRRVAAFFVTAGLVYCSSALVHISGGMIEAHFHFFILIGLIALYQDWVPFLWNVIFTVLSHGLGSALASDAMFDHPSGQNKPWHWALIHGVAVLAACIGELVFWKNTEREQERNVLLAAEMAAAEADQRAQVSALLVNLARRNQSLLDRQLGVIADLEQREAQPEVLDELFTLDHLATRIRRNAESLLVLSGDEPSRLWSQPVPLPEVVRAAAAEVEEYRRVDVQVNGHIEVAGRAVADLAHLLAELIENATNFSPPTKPVLIRSHLATGEPRGYLVSVEDVGIGMPADEMARANQVLVEAPDVDLRHSTMLGFHVVARLAARYGISVSLAPTPGGGVTALVRLPEEMVSSRGTAESGELVGAMAASVVGGQQAAQPPFVEPGSWIRNARPFVPRLEDVASSPPAAPPPPAVAPPRFAAPAPPAAASFPAAAPAGAPPPPAAAPPAATTQSGLTQRVPGANLAPALRQRGADEPPRPVVPPAAAPGAPPATPPGVTPRVPGANLAAGLRRQGPEAAPLGDRDAERVRSMLSRFQSGQRAGRAVSSLPGGDPDDTSTDPSIPTPSPRPEEPR